MAAAAVEAYEGRLVPDRHWNVVIAIRPYRETGDQFGLFARTD
jgi:hypothetical protein